MPLILLPPSESKTSAENGPALKVSTLIAPELNERREKVLTSLISLSNGNRVKARTVLGISAKQDFEVDRNQIVREAHCAPAWQIYTGVLFDAINTHALTVKQREVLERSVVVGSALFGAVAFSDFIPAYRLSGDCVLPKLGSLTSVWSKSVSGWLSEQNDLVIDLRSGMYVKLGPIPSVIADRAVVPKILQKMPSGPPKVVSHHNKATKGRIVRAFAESKRAVKSIDDFANVIASLGADVDFVTPKKAGQPVGLNVVVDVL